jgi:branched-subunit amino acid transport protein
LAKTESIKLTCAGGCIGISSNLTLGCLTCGITSSFYCRFGGCVLALWNAGWKEVTLWFAILASSALVYSWKLFGYLVPERFVSNPKIKELAALLTVALLAALVGIQTFVSAEGVEFDARIPALVLAAGLFYLRVPFIVVVIAAAATAALLRLLF